MLWIYFFSHEVYWPVEARKVCTTDCILIKKTIVLQICFPTCYGHISMPCLWAWLWPHIQLLLLDRWLAISGLKLEAHWQAITNTKTTYFIIRKKEKTKYISPDSGLFWLASWYVLCTLLSIFFCGLDWSARFAMKANWKLHPSQQISLWEIHFPKFNVSHQSLIFRCEIN